MLCFLMHLQSLISGLSFVELVEISKEGAGPERGFEAFKKRPGGCELCSLSGQLCKALGEIH